MTVVAVYKIQFMYDVEKKRNELINDESTQYCIYNTFEHQLFNFYREHLEKNHIQHKFIEIPLPNQMILN